MRTLLTGAILCAALVAGAHEAVAQEKHKYFFKPPPGTSGTQAEGEYWFEK